MLYIFTLIVALLGVIYADQTNWVGTYSDPTYGGLLNVCVTNVGGVYYGQALMSDVGYLRGTISSANVWTGNYYLSGLAGQRGTFSLTLSTDFSTYSGTYFQAGSDISYTVSSAARTSSLTPTDIQCFKADPSMLTATTNVNMTAAYDACEPGGSCYTIYFGTNDDSTSTTSYIYNYPDGTPSPGCSEGAMFMNGQIVTNDWYETGPDNGIELMVAKNATYFYVVWWFFPSMADFDYSLQNIDYFGSYSMPKDNTISTATANSLAYENVCYALWTTDAETSCLDTSTSNDDNDDGGNFSDADHSLLAVTTAFSVMSFALVLALTVYIVCGSRPSTSMAAQASAPAATPVTVEMK